MQEKIRIFKEKLPIVFSVVLLIIVELVRNGLSYVIRMLTAGKNIPNSLRGNSNLSHLLGEVLFFVLVLLAVFISGQLREIKPKAKGLLKGMLLGWIFWFLAFVFVLGGTSEASQKNYELQSPIQIAAFIVLVVLVGITEEFFFRAVFAKVIFDKYAKTLGGFHFAVFMGALIFAGTHFFNILAGANAQATVIQVVALIMTGCLFGALYFRTGNVYVVAILHTVLDFSTMFVDGFWKAGGLIHSETVDFWPSLWQSVRSQAVFLLIAIILLRPKKAKQIIRENHIKGEEKADYVCMEGK